MTESLESKIGSHFSSTAV